ncbi:MAG: transglycosylase SLT domain-containing protein [Kofleriaceae bacterium]
MRPWLLVLALAACSGDDSHRRVIQPKPGITPNVKTDAGPPAGPGTLTEAMAVSYWTTPDEQAGLAAFNAKDWAAAKTAFTAARTAVKETDPKAPRLELLLGLGDAELNDATASAAHLAVAYKALPELSDYIGYHLARSLWLAHDPGTAGPAAMDIAQSVATDSIVGADAQILVGDLMRGKGDWPAVVTYYRDYLAKHPNGPFRSEARFDLADAITNAKGDAGEATTLYRQITIDDPLSSWTTKAQAALKGQTVDPLTGAEHITQGMVLFDNMRNPESEKAFDDALADPKLSVKDKCIASYHRAQSRFKARDRKGASTMFDDAAVACKTAANTDLEIKSHYQAARSYSFIGQHETAIQHYKQAQTIDPKHSYADDATLREAEEWASLQNGAMVDTTLAAMPAKYPNGDNTAEAMWRLGFRAWREQRVDDAIKWWNEQIRLVPHDDNWFGEGQPQYWLGRAYAMKKDLPKAIEKWTETIRTYPLSYYTLLALNRLRDAAPQQYQALVTELAKDPDGAKGPAFTFKARSEFGAPGFARAMEMLRLGLGEPAEKELKKLGLTTPGDRKRVDDPDKLEKLWAMAFLYDRAGRFATSIWPTRWHALDYRRAWPTGANRAKWLIAYPKAYWALLTKYAQINNVPIAMQIGIVREESGFDPLDESYANAIGLTQMIPSTAHDNAPKGVNPTREYLRDPENNVIVGSHFLGGLFKKWNNFTLLVPTSYNAGPAGVTRMLRVRGTWDSDEFVEGIVDDQARNYTKRVLDSFFTYTYLYEGTVPEIPNKIPTELLPKK